MLTNWFFFVRTRKKKHIEEQYNLKAPSNVDDVLSFAFNFAIKVEKRTSFKYNETNIFLATPKKSVHMVFKVNLESSSAKVIC